MCSSPLPNVSDQPRGPSEDGVTDADESCEDGRLPALRCGDWFGSFFIPLMTRRSAVLFICLPGSSSFSHRRPREVGGRQEKPCHRFGTKGNGSVISQVPDADGYGRDTATSRH